MGGAGVGEEVIHLTVSGFIIEVFFFFSLLHPREELPLFLIQSP